MCDKVPLYGILGLNCSRSILISASVCIILYIITFRGVGWTTISFDRISGRDIRLQHTYALLDPDYRIKIHRENQCVDMIYLDNNLLNTHPEWFPRHVKWIDRDTFGLVSGGPDRYKIYELTEDSLLWRPRKASVSEVVILDSLLYGTPP